MKRIAFLSHLVLAFYLCFPQLGFSQAEAFSVCPFLPDELELAEMQTPWLPQERCSLFLAGNESSADVPGYLTITNRAGESIQLFVDEEAIGEVSSVASSHFEVKPGRYYLHGSSASGDESWSMLVHIKSADLAHIALSNGGREAIMR